MRMLSALLNIEYNCVLQRAGREGWLADLAEAHATPCTIDQAKALLSGVCSLPGGTRITFRTARGRARFNKHKRYHLGLPFQPGARQGKLRAGLVLHEAAHIWEHKTTNKFGHQEPFCQALRKLLTTPWRRPFMTSSFKEIYDRHKGPYAIMLTRVVEKGKHQEQVSDRLTDRFTAEEAHEEARMLVNDPRENIISAYVYSESEGQYIGATYNRGTEYAAWADERMELPDERPEPTLLRERPEPLPQVDAAEHADVPAAALPRRERVPAVPKAPGPPRKVGLALTIVAGKEGDWPKSPPAQEVLTAFKAGPMTAKQAAETLGPKMVELGVAHPASLISRLKQAGLLTEVKE